MKKFLYENTAEGGNGAGASGTNDNGADAGNSHEQNSGSGTTNAQSNGGNASEQKPLIVFDTPPARSTNPVVLDIVADLKKPTEGDQKNHSADAAQHTENIKKEILEEQKTETTAQQKTEASAQATVTVPKLSAADIALNELMTRSFIEGIDDVNSYACMVVAEEDKKDMFRAAAKNKDELAKFCCLMLEKWGGKLPIWIYGLWITGKTFAPGWIVVGKLRKQKNKIQSLESKLKQEIARKETVTVDPQIAELLKKQGEMIEQLRSERAQSGNSNYDFEIAKNEKLARAQEIEKNHANDFDEVNANNATSAHDILLNQIKTNEFQIDAKAPFGRDEKGNAKAPYGVKADGTIRRSAGGRTSSKTKK